MKLAVQAAADIRRRTRFQISDFGFRIWRFASSHRGLRGAYCDDETLRIGGRIWSAVTCHRFCRFGDLSRGQGRVRRPGRVGRLPAFDGDKSPAESADKSAHSKLVAAPPRWEISVV